MYLYIAFVILLTFAVMLFLTVQVLIPLKKGTPLFPIFRPDTPLKKELEQYQQEVEELAEVVEVKAELDNLKRRKAELEKK